jgi:hypothetical protein
MKRLISYKGIRFIIFSIVVFFGLQISAYANVITVDAGWYGFCFGGSGSGASAGCQNSGIGVSGNPTTFTASYPVEFMITDAFDHGDTFNVWINGVFSFTTPTVTASSGSVGDPDVAFADPLYSHDSILLSAGSYTIDVLANASPWGGGGAYLQARSVPEPTTMLLLGLGLVGLAGVRRKMDK